MHKPLLAAYSKFGEASKGLEAKIVALNDELTIRRLERLAADQSAKLRYLSEKLMYDAKKLVNLSDISEFKELNADTYSKALDLYNS
jgi:hypothetical protein